MVHNWLDREAYPFTSHFFKLRDGAKMHYIEEGSGPVILMVHGTPSWSFDFRHIIKALSGRYTCIAIDHIGFGLSDKSAGYPYSTLRHSENLEEFILSKGLKNMHLIVHDFGGPIGISVALRYPERFVSYTFLNTWLWNTEHDPAFKRLRAILKSPVTPWLYRYLNFSPRWLMPASFGSKKLPARLRKQYTAPFPNPDSRYGPLAFARSLWQDQGWFGEIRNKLNTLNTSPILVIWGMKDAYITSDHLDQMIRIFPDSTVIKLPDCGHFPQEECPQSVIEALTIFLNEIFFVKQ